MGILLQITQGAAQAVDTANKVSNSVMNSTNIAPAQPLSFLELIMKGGWVMYPLGVLSVIAIYLSIERFLTIYRASKIDANFMKNIRDYLMNGKMEAAVMLCKNTNTPIARLLLKGIKRIGKPIKEVESAVENEGKLEIYRLEKNLNF